MIVLVYHIGKMVMRARSNHVRSVLGAGRVMAIDILYSSKVAV